LGTAVLLLDANGDSRTKNGLSHPLFVSEPKPLSFELLLEHRVLFDEIVDDRLVVAVKRTDQDNYEEIERLYDICHSRTDYP
jgi:hypothetical protein